MLSIRDTITACATSFFQYHHFRFTNRAFASTSIRCDHDTTFFNTTTIGTITCIVALSYSMFLST
jgi:hypothetical protein